MKNRAVRRGFMRLFAILLSAFMTVSLFVSCDENESGGGEYKDPTQSDNGSDNAEEGGSSENGTNADGAEGNGDIESDFSNGLPTVEFPVIPFD